MDFSLLRRKHEWNKVRAVKVTVLVDNSDGIRVKGEWGLSLYIEYGGSRILLDAGLSDLFAGNADELGIDLSEADLAVLSHAHDDHANGLDRFLDINKRAMLYIAAGCYENCYDRPGIFYKYAGIPRGILSRRADRIVRAEGRMQIEPGVWLLPHVTDGLDKVGLAERMYLKQGFLKYVPDDFRHEQSLVFELENGIVVLNSCSHAGADVIINEAAEAFPGRKILAMIGGFHLFNKNADYVREFAKRVKATGVESVYTGHCTGKTAEAILREELGDKLHSIYSGMEFEI